MGTIVNGRVTYRSHHLRMCGLFQLSGCFRLEFFGFVIIEFNLDEFVFQQRRIQSFDNGIGIAAASDQYEGFLGMGQRSKILALIAC